MSDWSLSRAKARIDRREELDELTARIRYEVRVHLNEPTAHSAYDELADLFAIGHAECSALLNHRRILPLWERLLLKRYTRRLYGKAIMGAIGDLLVQALATGQDMDGGGHRSIAPARTLAPPRRSCTSM